MAATSRTDMTHAYSVSIEDQASIDTWMSEHLRPSILIHAPARDMGERELVEELLEASYRLQGFRDARRRHFLSRRFPQSLSDTALARFCDQAFDVSEVSDGFRGVDLIDISDWLGCRHPQEVAQWQRLASYIQDHPETDFVFLAYGDAAAVADLGFNLSSSSGNAVLSIRLAHPSPEQLADVFVSQSPKAFEPHRDRIVALLSALIADGRHVTYSAIRAAAVTAAHSASLMPDTWQAIRAALNQASTQGSRGSFGIGFTGGER